MNKDASGAGLRRRDTILRIVTEERVRSQEELQQRLRRQGIRVTQPTLSRDLRELGVLKTPAGYVVPSDLAPSSSGAPVAVFAPRESREERFEQLVRNSVLSAVAAGHMVVIKTPAAAAQPVASAIDTTPIDDVLGTIGGDDTIFVAFRTPTAAASFARRVHEIAPGLTPVRRRTRA